jgi:cobalt-zinc-cadmium efflux system outer membrane protein
VFEDDKNALYNTVKADWFTLYALNQQSYFLKENIKIYRIYKDLATVSFKNDKSSMADVLRVDIAIDDLETQVIILDQKIVPIVASFNSYLNRSIFADIDLPEQLTSIDTSLMDIKSNNLVSQNPLVGAYALRIEALESQALVVQKQNNPKIGVGLDYVFVSKIEGSSIPKNGNDIFMPMMSLSIPIHGRKNKARIKEVEFKQVAADSSLQWFTNRLNVRVQQENYLLKSGIEMMDLMDAQIEQTQRVISLLTVAYSNAGKDFEEILRLEQKLLHYKINKVMAESQAHKAVAAIEYLTGTI